MQKNCIILASGNGSNALNLIGKFYGRKNNGSSSINIVAVVSNVPNAPVVEKVRKNEPELPVFVIPFTHLSERDRFERELDDIIGKYNIDFIILAGFMRILSKEFVSKFSRKIINIHPSLLPAFKGRDSIKRAYGYGVKYTGVTVHYVTPEVDSGEIICQEVVKIEDNDDIDSLEAKVHSIEHKIYPIALKSIIGDVVYKS
ncbi:phosphoribosylglycinamide formyltransferase [Candidatus Acidulodesulfobacterium sp. H_13]|uniref:phosphoribosylglycinamide formyltransferase n=1 Tax=Candidatus Acidulodesulfobacterium sp. H_13 TaxID=3395470 RepID=UPI003AF92A71